MLKRFALVLVLMLGAVAACGDDEAVEEEAPQTSLSPEQRSALARADSVRRARTAGDPETAAEQPGAPSPEDGQQAQPAPGDRRQAPPSRPSRPDARTGGEPRAEPRGRLYTVQVAAFRDADTARDWEARLRRQGLPVWTTVEDVRGQQFHRLRVGAAPTVGEARRLGDMLSRRYEWPVWVAPVTSADQVPEDAVDRTRTIIRSE